MYPVGQYRLLFIQYLWCLRLQHFHQLHLQTWHNCNKSSIFGVRGTTAPRALVFARSNVLVSRIRDFNLVGHWALDLKTLCALTCSIGLMAIGPDKPWTLGTLQNSKTTMIPLWHELQVWFSTGQVQISQEGEFIDAWYCHGK